MPPRSAVLKKYLPIIVAVLGLVGTVAAAIIGKSDTFFGRHRGVAVDVAIHSPLGWRFRTEMKADVQYVSTSPEVTGEDLSSGPSTQVDIKVVNNSKETLVLTQALIQVAESRADPWPRLRAGTSPCFKNEALLHVTNYGWGEVSEPVLRFNLDPGIGETLNAEAKIARRHANAPPRPPYKFERRLPSFRNSITFDVWKELDAAGVDLAKLKRDLSEPASRISARALGPFASAAARLSGELTYRAQRVDGSIETEKLIVDDEVSLSGDGCGGDLPVSVEYEASRFRVGEKNYTLVVPISQEVKAGSADRLVARIEAAQSARHTFRVRLLYNGHREVESRTIVLDLYVPNDHKSTKDWGEQCAANHTALCQQEILVE